MSKGIKCIICQSWDVVSADGYKIESRTCYVTNEDGTPHVYDTINKARADIRGNYGRYPNANGFLRDVYTDEYSGKTTYSYISIIREDSDDYEYAMRKAEKQAAENAETAATTKQAEEKQAKDETETTDAPRVYGVVILDADGAEIETTDYPTEADRDKAERNLNTSGYAYMGNIGEYDYYRAPEADNDTADADPLAKYRDNSYLIFDDETATEEAAAACEAGNINIYNEETGEYIAANLAPAGMADALVNAFCSNGTPAEVYDACIALADAYTSGEDTSAEEAALGVQVTTGPFIKEWHMVVNIDETVQDFCDPLAEDATDETAARETLRRRWNHRKERRFYLAPDTDRIVDVYYNLI